MGIISNAVGQELISRVVGYAITPGQIEEAGANLPQYIAVFGPANHANQASLGSTPTPEFITNAARAATLYGAGSPLHQIARILFPIFGSGVGGIPVKFFPQLEGTGATGTTIDLDVANVPTQNTSHRLRINGRDNVDGEIYEYSVETTDTAATIRQKIVDAINAVTNSPVTASIVTDKVRIATKWYGTTSTYLNVEVDNRGNNVGLGYTINNKINGTVSETITTSLTQIGTDWVTLLINPYGADKFVELEQFNGTPTNRQGRYSAIDFKPLFALFGTTLAANADITALTNADARQNQVTNVHCPAPNSQGYPWEAAANMARLISRNAQDTPHLDISGQSYPDMPVPVDNIIGDMAQYVNRDFLVKRGSTTVDLVNGRYEVQDLVTTYHPDGEMPPQFRYVRNLIVDWNIRYGYFILERQYVRDKALADNAALVLVSNVIKPKEWISILFGYADTLGQRALIVRVDFMKESIVVGTSGTNPDRLETFFKYQRSGVARISSTTAEANFAFNL